MFKIISAEIKKIVSKPGIYILAILLAAILTFGVFIYEPALHDNSAFILDGVTYIEKHTNFTGNGELNAGKMAECNTKIENAIQSVRNYRITTEQGETYSQQEYIQTLVNKYAEIYDSYQDSSTDQTYQEQIDRLRNSLIASFEELNLAIENAFSNSQLGSYTILSSKENYETYKSTYKEVLSWAKTSVKKENLTQHFSEFENKYKNKFYSTLNNFKYPTLSDNFINSYISEGENSKRAILNERLNAISSQVDEHFTLSYNDSTGYNIKNAHIMDELANLYVDSVDTYASLIRYELINNAFSVLSTSEHIDVMYLSEYSQFNSKSMLAKYNYLFENNKKSLDFANPLTIGVTSNGDINAYDYSYFVLKIFSFVIIIYAIMACCHSIAGEVKEGSMRYLAIRPVSRKELFFGKWLSVIFMSTILIIFSSIISLCVGSAVYGMSSKTILTVFNGTTAFTIHPLGMIGIYLLSLLFELLVYSLLGMLLSVLFKSDLMSVTVLLMLYLLNTLVPIFVQEANSWLTYYPFSHISLYALFGSAVYAVPYNFFNLVFGAKVYTGTHALLTISVILLTIFITSILAIKAFKNKEL